MAVLSLCYSGKELRNYPIGMGDAFVIGRHPVNDIVIDNLAVSFQHAKIESIADEFLLIDLKSENGSFVNNQRIKAHWLIDGDEISIGKHTLVFSNPKGNSGAEHFSASIIKTMQIDTEKVRALLSQSQPTGRERSASKEASVENRKGHKGKLVVLSGERQELVLGSRSVRIGKSSNADIRVRGFGVGLTAAVINRLEDGWYLSYVGGLSRIRVNREVVTASVKLNRLDVIRLGRTTIQFLHAAGEDAGAKTAAI
jgi:pSer/pThr/pTyr-binding forkhead associated (FHA) protein